jgi:AefR-like transcriptional repressor, C-terminal domain/Bacterial regulatory proteins, tetR family
MHKFGWALGAADVVARQIVLKMNDLRGISAVRRGSVMRDTVRYGRPPKELAGEVEERILDAAREVFLEHGFGGASIDEIAAVGALFTAVVTRDIVTRISHFKAEVTGTTVEERFASAGIALLRWTLVNERFRLMRLAIAEAHRFPDLATSVSRAARDRSTEVAARLLGEMAQSDELGTLPAFAPERLESTARFFLDLIVIPILVRALFGEDLTALREEIGPHVARRVAFFLAACRHGGVT